MKSIRKLIGENMVIPSLRGGRKENGDHRKAKELG